MLIDSHDDTRVEVEIRVDIQPYRGILASLQLK